MNQILNIINFIRGVEPREGEDWDLLRPVKEQIGLIDRYGFSATFLIQYDALLMPEYQTLLRSLDPARYEIGVWYEIVEPLTNACKMQWRGRWSWDPHCHCGFPVGYSKEQRELLADELFRAFREVFGYYPRVFGSWFYDSHTVRYICDRYGLDALCNCKEQYGTDGYTLWGGYYGQGYYPSRRNVFMPAGSEEMKLPTPLFRMLGSDPVYQYDFGTDAQNGAQRVQGVITLEPVYKRAGGGLPAWVDWFLRENYNGECLSFGYAQAGQENSFGWEAMKDGLTYQFDCFHRMASEGKLIVEPLGATGRRFKADYPDTPPSAITAHTAYDDPDKDSVWYSSKHYRVNLYGEKGQWRIRDLHVFSDSCPDPYETELCTGNDACYETLPVADGNLFSGNGVTAGVYLTDVNGNKLPDYRQMRFTDLGNGRASIWFTGENMEDSEEKTEVLLSEDSVTIQRAADFLLTNLIGSKGAHLPEIRSVSEKQVRLRYKGTDYTLTLTAGRFLDAAHICSEDGKAVLCLRQEQVSGNLT